MILLGRARIGARRRHHGRPRSPSALRHVAAPRGGFPHGDRGLAEDRRRLYKSAGEVLLLHLVHAVPSGYLAAPRSLMLDHRALRACAARVEARQLVRHDEPKAQRDAEERRALLRLEVVFRE